MLKFTTTNRIGFIGKATELLVFLKYLSSTYPKIKDIKQVKYYS
jgi:hypothetical protein